MKTIKNIVLTIAATIGGIVAFFLLTKSKKSKKLEKLDKQIDEKKQKVDIIETEIAVVETKRKQVKQEIIEVKEQITELKDAKENLTIEDKPADEVKDNILKQTRRGRPKKS